MTMEITFMKRHPELAAEWSEKNFPHKAEEERAHSKEKRWWKCSVCGNEWQAETVMRAAGKCRCPYCHNRKLRKGFNDLESKYPELAAEWNYERNGALKPDMVIYGSAKRVWWKCRKGHSWKAEVSHRALRGSGCPYCAREDAEPGIDDAATVFPELAAWWSPKNNLKAEEVKSDYPGMIWWLCPRCGVEYQSRIRIQHRMRENRCPYCRGRYVKAGTNDIATTDPWVLDEWDFAHNAGVKPEEVTRMSERFVRWKCSKGHAWGSSIRERIVEEKGCPYCSGEIKEKETQETVAQKMEVDIPAESVYCQGKSNQNSMQQLPVWEKYALGIREASDYFVISMPKLRRIIRNEPDSDFLTWSGGNAYFIREKFEQYLNGQKNLPVEGG